MVEDKKVKVRKGWLVVAVGLDDHGDGGRRFSIPIAHLYHPSFQKLLEAASEAYGYSTAGPLRLPCSVDDFLRLRRLVEQESYKRDGGGHRGFSTRP